MGTTSALERAVDSGADCEVEYTSNDESMNLAEENNRGISRGN